jgi:hypothetical protein
MQKRMLDRTRKQLEITDDKEWQAIEPLITKVGEARMASLCGHGLRGFGGRGGAAVVRAVLAAARPIRRRKRCRRRLMRRRPMPKPKPRSTNLSADRKAKQADLEKAQANLRKVLTPRQEAIATLNGLL